MVGKTSVSDALTEIVGDIFLPVVMELSDESAGATGRSSYVMKLSKILPIIAITLSLPSAVIAQTAGSDTSTSGGATSGTGTQTGSGVDRGETGTGTSTGGSSGSDASSGAVDSGTGTQAGSGVDRGTVTGTPTATPSATPAPTR
jgi:hypothetical protein